MTTTLEPSTGRSADRQSPDRETVSERLLKGSVRRSYAPIVDIDWDAPLEEGKYFLPPTLLTLYGTPFWDSLTEQQRIDVSREEMANVLSVGLWFETLLDLALLHRLTEKDPAGQEAQYSLTEMGDECRHMAMFAKVIDRCGARVYRMSELNRRVLRLLPFTLHGSGLWLFALVGEEIFDAMQRRGLDDPQLQPIVSRLMRIHVTEEARHISFARDGLRRRTHTKDKREKYFLANAHGAVAILFNQWLTNPAMYRRAGLDGDQCAKIARSNPHFNAMKQEGFADLAGFLRETGFMGPIAEKGWRKAGFLP
ncbi:diiron oxygenase [Flexivirga sp. ID2601S]|uniref:Diiron oxygenase n=1 Tax=Flexivirga aerilata TaxID=1656889 RepID=A0A849AEU7_9MICO|nr:diiron oxygenase [Flexivirga aerilata]NNG39015.1 diiron oxygenase [Flexivirga aerilata]